MRVYMTLFWLCQFSKLLLNMIFLLSTNGERATYATCGHIARNINKYVNTENHMYLKYTDGI